MRYGLTLALLSAIGLAFGCGESTPRTTAAKTRQEAKEEPIPKNDRPTFALFADMPATAYPRSGPEGAIERAAARKWLKEKLPGRDVQWETTVEAIEIQGDDPFTVTLLPAGAKGVLTADAQSSMKPGYALGEPIVLGEQECQVVVEVANKEERRRDLRLEITHLNCTADEAKKLRALKGKKIVLCGTVQEAYLRELVYPDVPNEGRLIAELVPLRQVLGLVLVVPQLSLQEVPRKAP